jgi:asparagine synthase (glutamine-hydrolysing)
VGYFLSRRIRGVVKRFFGTNRPPDWLDEAWFVERGVPVESAGDYTVISSLRATLLEAFTRSSLPLLLRYEDRNSMAFGLESRVPFLTPRIVAFIFSLPEQYVVDSDGTSKRVFRSAMRGIVPDAILDRKDKLGFAMPEQSWLEAMHSWSARVLRSDAAHAIAALRFGPLLREYEAVLSGRRPFDWRIWRWLNLICWSEQLAIQF